MRGTSSAACTAAARRRRRLRRSSRRRRRPPAPPRPAPLRMPPLLSSKMMPLPLLPPLSEHHPRPTPRVARAPPSPPPARRPQPAPSARRARPRRLPSWRARATSCSRSRPTSATSARSGSVTCGALPPPLPTVLPTVPPTVAHGAASDGAPRREFSCCQQRECTVGTWVGATVGKGGGGGGRLVAPKSAYACCGTLTAGRARGRAALGARLLAQPLRPGAAPVLVRRGRRVVEGRERC
jgi:hypothetical protein